MIELEKSYSASEVEDKIYQAWLDSGFFNPDNLSGDPYTIILPPPNVTGDLHVGHALMLVIQDILIRYQRMNGKKTLWVPGTDHAAIATQSKVEAILYKEQEKTRYDLGREDFLKLVEDYAKNSHDNIVKQVKKMGASVDWSREAYTLDEPRSLAVRYAFKNMFDSGLIYKGARIVNWDPKLQTTVSDDEIEWKDETTQFYYLKYGPFTIATARPETKFGDKYVVMHPEDTRYKDYSHGQQLELEWINGPITATVIKDESIDMEFGTGVMTITPWHSSVDFEIAQRHGLDKEQIIDDKGKLLSIAGEFEGLHIKKARPLIIEKLQNKGLVEKIDESYSHRIATNSRGGGMIEPQIKEQWFIDVNREFNMPHSNIDGIKSGDLVTLKHLMRHVVENGNINIVPEHFGKIYFHWIDNLRDWCISRQIWYGHRVPVWYDENKNIILPSQVEIIFARHGESLSNTNGYKAGGGDSALTELGQQQAKTLGQNLKDKGIKKIVCSPLQRSIHTAKIASKELGIAEDKIEIWEEIKEVDLGEMNNADRTAISNPFGEAVKRNTGESLFSLEERGNIATEKIKTFSEGPVLIVGHNIMNSVLEAILDGKPKENYPDYRGRIGVRPNGSTFSRFLMPDPSGEGLTQDTDTLDTWFSSGLWTFSTLGWPNQTQDLANFHPTDVLETGYDILFFWVARMVLMTTYHLGEIPFKTVYLHGLIRDAEKQKMSKSKGNIVDPLDMISKYGTDALRFSLIFNTAPGTDMALAEDKIKGMKHFANKIWNIARYVLANVDEEGLREKAEGQALAPRPLPSTDADKEILNKLETLTKEVTEHIEKFRLHEAAQSLYQFTWYEFADIYIEASKLQLQEESSKESTQQILLYSLTSILKLLHPFMPFVTEEIWSHLGKRNEDGSKMGQEKLLLVTTWPK